MLQWDTTERVPLYFTFKIYKEVKNLPLYMLIVFLLCHHMSELSVSKLDYRD